MQAEPLITWSEPVLQFVGFIAQFLALGAVGFRYAAVRRRLDSSGDADAAERSVYVRATQRAATIGLIALLVQVALFANGLPRGASRAHLSVGAFITSDMATLAACLLFADAVIGMALAAGRRSAGWPCSRRCPESSATGREPPIRCIAS